MNFGKLFRTPFWRTPKVTITISHQYHCCIKPILLSRQKDNGDDHFFFHFVVTNKLNQHWHNFCLLKTRTVNVLNGMQDISARYTVLNISTNYFVQKFPGFSQEKIECKLASSSKKYSSLIEKGIIRSLLPGFRWPSGRTENQKRSDLYGLSEATHSKIAQSWPWNGQVEVKKIAIFSQYIFQCTYCKFMVPHWMYL